MAEQIVVTIAPDGTVRAETRGIKGKKCLDAIEVLEDLLDAQTASSSFTEEYQQSTENTESEVDDEQPQS